MASHCNSKHRYAVNTGKLKNRIRERINPIRKERRVNGMEHPVKSVNPGEALMEDESVRDDRTDM